MNSALSQFIVNLLICALLAPAVTAQPRPPAPDVVRTRVMKLGVGQSVSVREQSGIEMKGEITGIGPQVFQIQRRDAQGPTWVYYTNVVRLRRTRTSSQLFAGSSGKPWIATAFVLGIVLLYAICGDSSPCRQSSNTPQTTH